MLRRYDREFKLEAVRMASEPGVTAREVEKRLGIGKGVSFRLEASQAPNVLGRVWGRRHMTGDINAVGKKMNNTRILYKYKGVSR